MNKDKITNHRNPGFDLFRAISMIFIITLHIINKGRLINNDNSISQNIIYNSILSLCLCGVNCFVLISASFLLDSNKIKLSKVVQMIAELWIINFIVSVTGMVFEQKEVGFLEIVYLLFPFFTRQNWFINVYLLLYLLHPFLNVVLKAISKKQLGYLSLILFISFCILPSVLPNRNWTFDTANGYSITWFIALYVFCAFLKRESNKKVLSLHSWFYFLIIVFCILTMVSSRFFFRYLQSKIGIDELYIELLWFQYDSLFVLLESICLFCVFKNAKIRSTISIPISFIGSHTLGVYIIHDNFFIRERIWLEWINVSKFSGFWFGPIIIVLVAIVTLIACTMVYSPIHIFLSSVFKSRVFNKELTFENNE